MGNYPQIIHFCLRICCGTHPIYKWFQSWGYPHFSFFSEWPWNQPSSYRLSSKKQTSSCMVFLRFRMLSTRRWVARSSLPDARERHVETTRALLTWLPLRSSHVVTIFPFIDDVPKKTFVFMELPHVFWRGKSSRNDDKWIYMREIPQIWLRDVHPPKATRDYLGMSSKYMGGWHGEDDQVHLGWPQRHLSHSLSFAANVHTFFWETIQQSSLFLQ